MIGTVASVMTLLITVGWPNRPTIAGTGGFDAHDAALAFERFEQRGFLAADVRAGALRALRDRSDATLPSTLSPSQPAARAFAIARFERRDRVRIFAAHVDVAAASRRSRCPR